MLRVEWEEVVDHPGHFEFYFSPANDQNFRLITTVNDTQNNTPMPHNYAVTFQVPSTPCEACTLQMVQVMTENPAVPRNYYSCADIRIEDTGGVPTASPVPTTMPTPTLSPTPAPSATPALSWPPAAPPASRPGPADCH
jgi:hypothetical protein